MYGFVLLYENVYICIWVYLVHHAAMGGHGELSTNTLMCFYRYTNTSVYDYIYVYVNVYI